MIKAFLGILGVFILTFNTVLGNSVLRSPADCELPGIPYRITDQMYDTECFQQLFDLNASKSDDNSHLNCTHKNDDHNFNKFDLDPKESGEVKSQLMGLETLPSGTLIIPMDNNLQSTGAPFNIRAYGLVATLLYADVPLKWIIEPGKAKDGIDFSANASQVAPVSGMSTLLDFRSGPIAVWPGFESQALPVINAFNSGGVDEVNVYELSQPASVNVKINLLQRPKAALLDNGGNQNIHEDIFIAAGLTENVHYVLEVNGIPVTAADIDSGSCYTFITEAHADEGDVLETEVNNVRNFLENGGNFLAQCAAGRAYEDLGTSERLITLNGVDDPGIDGIILYDNVDKPYSQFQGELSDEGGSAKSYKPVGNAYKPGALSARNAYDSNDPLNYKAYSGRVPNMSVSFGGEVFYLAGHSYDGNDIEKINGYRMYLNAFLTRADRPTACFVDINPFAVDDNAIITGCDAASIVIDILANDTDLLGGSLTATIVGNGIFGTFVNNGDGTVTYTPFPGNWPGYDSVQYEVCNEEEFCNYATITVTSGISDNEISGNVFIDPDEDGIYSPGESGADSISVNLYLDENGNGLVDNGDTFLATQMTAGGGEYSFSVSPTGFSSSTTVLNSDKATSNYEGVVNEGYGNCIDNYISEDGGNRCYTFVQFDLSSIPDNCVVTNATLTLTKAIYNGTGDDFTFGVRQVTQPWVEGNGICYPDGNASGLTWQQSSTGLNWTTPGGDFTSTVYDTATGGDNDPDGTQYSFDVTALVNEWESGTPNNGLAIVPTAFNTSGGTEIFAFYGDEASSADQPKLSVTTNCALGSEYVLEVDVLTLPPGTFMTTNNVSTASFNSVGQLDCDNNFGFNFCDPNADFCGTCAAVPGSAVVTGGSLDGTEEAATGLPDDLGAQMHTNGDEFHVMMGGIIPAGGTYTIRWRERPGESGTPIPEIYESSDGLFFNLHPGSGTFQITSGTTWSELTITASQDVYYIGFGKGMFSTTDYEVDAITSEDCTEPEGIFGAGWSFECEDDVSVDIIGHGIENDLPVTVNLANPSALFAAIAEVIYKGSNPGPSITLTDQSLNTYTANRVTPPGSSSNVWYYRAEFPAGTSQITYSNTTNQGSAQSMVVYGFYQGLGDNESSSGLFVSQSLYQDTYDFILDIPSAPGPRDVTVTVPLSEITNDGRVATVVASSGGVTGSQTINGSDLSLGDCCLNIVTIVLPDVPGNATMVDISVQSLPVGGVQPQSLVLAGFVEASTDCGCININDPGSIGYDEEGCAPLNPALIESLSEPDGGVGGVIEFEWEQSTDNGVTWTIIPGATGSTYSPSTLSETTLYRRKTKRSTCDATEYLFSNVVTKTVVSNYLDGGIIEPNETNCGPFDPDLITEATPPSGGVGGTIEYQWQSRVVGGTWSDIPFMTGQTYDPNPISQTMQYRRLVRLAPCADWMSSNIVNKIVIDVPADVSATASGDLTCSTLFVQLTGSSSTNGVTYAWTGPGGFSSNQQTPFVVLPGNYSLTVSNQGCDVSTTVTVNQDISGPGASATGGVLTCAEPAILIHGDSPTSGVTFAWTGPGGFTSNLQNPAVTSVGTYDLTVTNPANGCSSTTTAEVNEDLSAPVVSVDQVIDETCTGNDGSITISVSGGAAPYSVIWSDIMPEAWWTMEGNTNDISGNVHNAVTEFGTLAYSSDAVNGGQSLSLDGATAVRYSVDGGFMESAYSAISIGMWIKPASFSGIQNIYEEGGPTNGMALRLNGSILEGAVRSGGIQVNATPIPFPNDNEWHHVALVFDNGTLTMYLDGVSSGTSFASFYGIPAHPSDGGLGGTFGGDCFGNSAPSYFSGLIDEVVYVLQPLSGMQVAGLANSGFTYSGLSTGNYTVLVTGTNGCSTSVEITVGSDTTEPGASASGGTLTCSTTSIQLTGSSPTAGVIYEWSGPSGFSSNQQNPTVSEAGTYTVLVTDPANSCTSTASVAVDFVDDLGANITQAPTQLCTGEQGVFEAADEGSGTTYTWDFGPGAVPPTADGNGPHSVSYLTPGQKTVTLTTDKNGCMETDQVVVNVIETPHISGIFPTDPTCSQGGSIHISSSPDPSNLEYNIGDGTGWYPGQSTFNDLPAGTYTISVRVNGGFCEISGGQVQLLPPPLPTIASVTSTDETLCDAEDGTITINIGDSGTPPYTAFYTFEGNTIIAGSFSGTSFTITGLAPGVYSDITIIDSKDCSDAAGPVTIGEAGCCPEAIIINDNPDPVCVGGNATFTAVDQGVGATYAWDFGTDAIPATAAGPGPHSVVYTSAGVKTISLDVTKNDCTVSTTTTLNVDAPAAQIEPIPQTCVGEGVLIQAIPAGPNAIYAWDFGPNATPATSTNITETVIFSTQGMQPVTLVVTDENGCSSSVAAVAPVDPDLFSDPGPDRTICEGDSTQLGVDPSVFPPGATFQWIPSDYLSDPSAAQPWASPPDTINYTLVVTFGNCVASEDVNVNVNVAAVPSLFAGFDQTTCAGEPVTLGGSGNNPTGPPGATFMWTADPADPTLVDVTSPNPVVYPTESTTYTVAVTRDGCTKYDDMFVFVLEVTPADAGEDQFYCLGGDGVFVGTTNNPFIQYSWTPLTGLTLSPGAGGIAIAEPSETTTYTLTTTDLNGCITTDDVTITVIDVQASATGGTLNCLVSEVQLTGSSNLGTVSFQWSGPGGFSSSQQNPVVNVPGIYTLTVTEPVNNCTAIEEVTVIEDIAEPGANATGGTITCANPTVTLNGISLTPGVIFAWTGPNGFISPDPSPVVTETGTYNLTVTNPVNGCVSTASAIVDTPPVLTATASGETLLCFGETDGNIDLTVSGGTPPFTFDWDNDGAGDNDDTEDLSGLSAGIYNVTITDANSCVATASAEISQPPLLTATATGESLLCYGDNDGNITLTVNGGTSPYTFDWDNDGEGDHDDDQDLGNLSGGIYSVTVTDANGCIVTASAEIIEPSELTANAAGEALLCFSDADGNITLTVNGGSQPYTFDWDNDGTGDNDDPQNLSDLTVGIYNVTIIDANGCSVTASAEITEPSELTASATGDAVLCFGDNDGNIDLTVTGGTQPYTFDWSNDGFGDNNDSEDLNNLNAGNFTVIVTDANGCTISTSAEVTQPPLLEVSVAQDEPVVCFGENNGIATANVSGGMPPYTYAWDTGETTATATMLGAGVHTVFVSDANGCNDFQLIGITQPPQLIAAIEPIPQTCEGEGVLIQAIPAGPNVSYQWDFGADADPQTSNVATQTVVYSSTGDKVVTLVVTDENGCTDTTTAIAQVDPPVNADPGPDRTICEGESIQIGAFDAFYPDGTTFEWVPALGLDDPNAEKPFASPSATTTYSLFVTYGNCVSTADITVNVDVVSVPFAFAGNDQVICSGDELTLGGNGNMPTGIEGSAYFWTASPPDPSLIDVFSANPVVSPAENTVYTVTVMRNGCSRADDISVLVLPSTPADAGENQTMCAGEGPVTIGTTSSVFFSYSWSPMDGIILPSGPGGIVQANPEYTTVYTLTQTDASGCESTDEVAVIVIDCNDAPVGIHDINNTLIDTPVSGFVLTNDYDLNNDNLTVTEANGLPVVVTGTSFSLPNGFVTIFPDGSYDYIPNAGFTGTEQFSYTVCDDGTPGPKCDSANVTLEVRENTAGNDPPIANDDVTITPQNFLGTSNLLDNDADPDGDSLILNLTPIDFPDNGNIFLNPEGVYTYTPYFGFQGEDSFVYEICDLGGLCDTATVTIHVFRVPPANNPAVAIDDSEVTLIDTPVGGNVLDNDYDPDSDVLQANTTPTDTPDNGSVVLNTDGTFVYTPNSGFTGTDEFSYQMCDPFGLCDQATVVISVYNQVNQLPVAGDDFASTEPGLAVDFDLKPNDYDPDGDPVTYTLLPVTGPSNGTLAINPDGTVRYTPDVTFAGIDQFEYEICDNISGCDTATVTIEVYNTTFDNDPPIATDDVNGTPQATPVSGNVINNDNDPDEDALTVTTPLVSIPANGTAIIDANGDYTYTPDPGFSGTDTFIYEVCDGISGCDQATVAVVVFDPALQNDPPVANDDLYSAQVSHPTSGNVLNNDYDVNGDPVIFSPAPVTSPDNGSLTLYADGSFIYIPDQGFSGVDTFSYEICDGHGLCDEADVIIEVYPFPYQAINSNLRPFAGDDAVATFVDEAVIGGIMHTNDIDPDITAMTYNLTPVDNVDNGSVIIYPDGTFDYTPNPGYIGPDQFIYEVCDGAGWCVYATVYITVYPNNAPPVAIDDFNNTLGEVPVGGNVITNDYDPDLNNISVAGINGLPVTPTGTLALTGNGGVTIYPDGSYTFMAYPGFTGEEQFTYEICDDGVPGPLCSEATVTITVFSPHDPNNNPPVANTDATETEMDTPVMIQVLSNDYDPDNDVLFSPTETAAPSNGTVSLSGDVFTYTPDPGFIGKDTFYYQTCDPFGLCDDAMVTIVITRDEGDDNNPPVAVDDAVYTPMNETVSGNAASNDNDPDNDSPLIFSITSIPVNGTVTFGSDGWFTYTPNTGYTGPDQFTYQVCDLVSGCDEATVYIVVGPRNDPPVAINDINNTLVDIPVNGNVLSNDYDLNGDNINITEVNGMAILPGGTTVPTPNGSVTVFNDGSYVYTPDPGYTGEDQFGYTICDDGIPGPICSNATVTIEIFSPDNPVNNPPVANDDATETEENSPVTINVAANDYDPDGDILAMPTSTSSASNGIVSQNPDGTFVYTPNPGFTGNDSFTYSVCDPSGLCDEALVTIVITPDNGDDNDPPVAVDDAVYTPFDTPVSGDASFNDYDPDGDTPLVFTTLSSAANGSVVFSADGTFTYTPDAGFSGPDNFVYQVCDGISGCDQATVDIVVGPRNNPPVAVNDDNNTFVDTPVSGNLLTNDYDPDNDLISFGGIEVPALPGVFVQTPVFIPGISDLGLFVANAGNLVPNPDGTYVFEPASGFSGTAHASYRICDNGIPGPMCDEGVLTIVVTPFGIPGNQPPIANDDDNITEAGTSVNGTVISNDADPDGDALTVSGFASGGSFTNMVLLPEGTFEFTNPGVLDNGNYTFTPSPGFTGEVTIEYEVCDLGGSGICTTAELTIIVLPDDERPNDPPFAGDDFATTSADQPASGSWYANDGDPNDDNLSINGFGLPVNPMGSPTIIGTYPTAMGGSVEFHNNGTFTYTPPAEYVGPDQVTYQICEISTSELYCADATVYLLVLAGNEPPVAMDDFNNTIQDVDVSGSVMTNDYDPEGDVLTVSGFSLSPGGPYNISVVLSGQGILTLDDPLTGAYTFDPDPDFIGTTDPVEYEICDAASCVTANLVIEVIDGVNPLNIPPVANNDHNQTEMQTPVGGNILSNDFDPDFDTFSITGGGTTGFSNNGGTWSLNADGSYLYLPSPGFEGLDTLMTYEICDGISGCDEAVLTVLVTPASGDMNLPPVAVDDAYITDYNQSLPGNNVTENDPSDPDGDDVTVTRINGVFVNMAGTTITTVNGGVVQIFQDGTFSYDPATDFSGPDHFVYEVCDGISGCDFATVYITVLPEICIDVTVSVFLQGAYMTGSGSMRTDLNIARGLLPGQTPANPLVTPTPPGNPYRNAPWNYDGTPAEENYTGPYTNLQGLHVVDWVLISLRSTPSKVDEFSVANGLLYSDGSVEFIRPCILTSSDPSEVWIVVEHRNHMGVMSDSAITVVDGTLEYDFRQTDSYKTMTSFGQSQVVPGTYAMYAGDGDQMADFPSYDINGLDNIVWTQQNGNFDQYLEGDYDLNGDVNGADIILWSQNNGLSSAVPKD